MKSWITQMLFLVAAVIFLLKGGFRLFTAFWGFLLPLLTIGAGIYFFKQYMKQQSKVSGGANNANSRVGQTPGGADVIEICPHCHQEVGSCPKCKRR